MNKNEKNTKYYASYTNNYTRTAYNHYIDKKDHFRLCMSVADKTDIKREIRMVCIGKIVIKVL